MRCPVCSGPAETLFARSNQPGSVHMPEDRGMTVNLACCRDCAFCFNRDAFADPAAFTAWMAPAYRSYALLDNDLHGFPRVDGRTLAAGRFLDAHCPWDAVGHVLEVGSNRGDFLAFLRERHPHVHLLGVKSSPLSLVGVPTLFHDVRELRFSASFDLVIARQVLEHLADPVEFTAHLAGFVRPGGWLFYEFPLLENELDEGVDPFVTEHVGFWSQKALAALGERAGLNLAAVDRTYQMSALFRRPQADPGRKRPESACGRAAVSGAQGLACEVPPETGGVCAAGKAPSETGGGLSGTGEASPETAEDRTRRVRKFLAGVERTQARWREWARAGNEICFYGASNVFLAVSAVLRERWGRDAWSAARLTLTDDSPGLWGRTVGGLEVLRPEARAPRGPVLFVVCAMYRYHRAAMVPRVRGRLRPGDRLFAMWGELTP